MTNSSREKLAIIIGAGPAGLTAAYELLGRTNIRPLVLERSDLLGGLARTVNYKGNRIDIGGHRFFSKSDRVMQWWLDMLPLQKLDRGAVTITHQSQSRTLPEGGGFSEYSKPGDRPPDPDQTDRVMLVRSRKSRIYFERKFFNYPISLSRQTLANLGVLRVLRIGLSYAKVRLLPIRDEQNLEQFFINRFGRELYRTFFESYTEKVWGVPCREISAAWGAQRIKGLSISELLRHLLTKPFRRRGDLAQKGTQTSLIEQFLYPKLGPGQMWETCAAQVEARGGRIVRNAVVDGLDIENDRVVAVRCTDAITGEKSVHRGDYFISTMPIKELVQAFGDTVPPAMRAISDGLVYRDFITVGLLLRQLKVCDDTQPGQKLLKDNWLYIQEPDVRVGRLQIFNNWSPYLVADPATVWIGLEYFCYENDDLWSRSDEQMSALARDELAKIGIIAATDVLDSTVIRMPKTYPAYFGTYDRFDELRAYLDGFENLFLIGRNGQHRYNNQDHSMLAAMTLVDNLVAGRVDKASLWAVNAEPEYHEAKRT